MNDHSTVDLRSDTVTRPSAAMMQAIARAELGDDVYGGDPTVARLEAAMAERLNMEAGLFVTSGTQSNLCALLSHLNRGEEYIAGVEYHVFKHEACGSAVLGGLAPHPLPVPADGRLSPEDVAAAIRPDDVHYPVTRLLCLENTFNGVPIPLAHQERLADVAHRHGLKVHLDGARLFNAATALKCSAQALCARVDSVSVCLSKGLGAPVGSVLCGERGFIDKARRNRKMLGGGLRQSGILAACGLVALERETQQLHEDHERAARLADALRRIDAVRVTPESALTNMVFIAIPEGLHRSFHEHLAARGIVVDAQKPTIRLVVHRDVDDRGLERVIEAIGDFFGKRRRVDAA